MVLKSQAIKSYSKYRFQHPVKKLLCRLKNSYD
jgi:hypothetical protein